METKKNILLLAFLVIPILLFVQFASKNGQKSEHKLGFIEDKNSDLMFDVSVYLRMVHDSDSLFVNMEELSRNFFTDPIEAKKNFFPIESHRDSLEFIYINYNKSGLWHYKQDSMYFFFLRPE